MFLTKERFIKTPKCYFDRPEHHSLALVWRTNFGASSFKQQGKMTEYEKLELLHSQLDELINGNQLPVDELKILQSFVEDIREKHLTSAKQQA